MSLGDQKTNGDKLALICPTYNAGELWKDWISAVKTQTADIEVLVIDSGSKDQTVELAKEAGFNVLSIPNNEFNHGATRNVGANYFDGATRVFVYLTQDAILATQDSVSMIVKVIQSDDEIGAACGRQIPRDEATPIEAHARIFNYPDSTKIKSIDDAGELGIKVAFMSNSFAAYKREAFEKCGQFPNDTIFAEDMMLAAKMAIKGFKVAYTAEAKVYHSHDYTFMEEFKRYFDVGVFYSREKWIKEEFGSAGGEGLKYVKSEFKYLLKLGKPHLVLSSIFRNFLKLLAFRIGMMESKLPKSMKKKLSMNKRYWDR